MKVAGAQPKSTRAATAKTKPSETPFASASSTGTGKRSASVEATRNAVTPASVVHDPGSRKNVTVAAIYAETPTTETGATTASSLAGGSARPLIQRGGALPGEVQPDTDAVRRSDCNQRSDDKQGCDLRVPLKHGNPSRWVPHCCAFSITALRAGITRRGENPWGLPNPPFEGLASPDRVFRHDPRSQPAGIEPRAARRGVRGGGSGAPAGRRR